MRTLLKTLCVTLALALAALALPAGAFALGPDVDINETNFPDQIFRGWLLDKGNLNGMGADGVLTSGELAQITVEWYLDSSFTRPVRPEDQLPANGQTV